MASSLLKLPYQFLPFLVVGKPPKQNHTVNSKKGRGIFHFTNVPVHHCDSHGTPSPSPSILVFGQFRKKKEASAQDVISEQLVRPSHWKLPEIASGFVFANVSGREEDMLNLGVKNVYAAEPNIVATSTKVTKRFSKELSGLTFA